MKDRHPRLYLLYLLGRRKDKQTHTYPSAGGTGDSISGGAQGTLSPPAARPRGDSQGKKSNHGSVQKAIIVLEEIVSKEDQGTGKESSELG